MRLSFTCALATLLIVLSACGSSAGGNAYPSAIATATATAGPPGAISGDQLMYPADSMPALAISAISTSDSHRYFSVTTQAGQLTYTITGVAPGTYDVIAYLANGTSGNWKVLAGGYTQFVLCGLSATCSDHTLIPVTVAVGQTITHINPNDFYGGSTYPPRPGT